MKYSAILRIIIIGCFLSNFDTLTIIRKPSISEGFLSFYFFFCHSFSPHLTNYALFSVSKPALTDASK